MDIYHYPGKKEFIAALIQYTKDRGEGLITERGHAYRPCRGDVVLAEALAKWLENPEIPDNHMGFSWFRDMPEMLHEAFDDFRTLPEWEGTRKAYLKEVGEEVPDLVNIHITRYKVLAVRDMSDLVSALYLKLHKSERPQESAWLSDAIAKYCDAQSIVVDQAWKRFIKVAYRRFIKRYKTDSHTANSGVFGTTSLYTFGTAGRLMFTFERGSDSVTYIADDADLYGHRAGLNYTNTPYYKCVEMINDVTEHWDMAKLNKDPGVTLG